jgi:hypothetical protein
MIISGSVLDNDFKILPNVNVTVVGENGSTITDENGKFSVNVNSLNSQIRFSLVGYDYDTYAAKDVQNMSYINLYPSTIVLPDVNVPGTKSSSSIWAWVLGGFALLGIAVMTSKKNDKTVKVKM